MLHTLREKIGRLSFLEVSLRSAPIDDVSRMVSMIENFQQLCLGVVERVDDQARSLSAALSREEMEISVNTAKN